MSAAAHTTDSMLGKRNVIVEQSDRASNLRIKPEWQIVEEAAFKSLDHFPAGARRAVHWTNMGFDDFMDAGFITLYDEARQLRIQKLSKAPGDQFGYDGAVLYEAWEGAQVKHEREPVGPKSLGAFYSAIIGMRISNPDVRTHLLSTSGFTPRTVVDSHRLNFTLLSKSSTALLAAAAEQEPKAPVAVAGDDVANSQNLRKWQQDALCSMAKAFATEGPYVLGVVPGAGKTLACILLCLHEVARRFTTVVVASPRRCQVSQTKRRFDAVLDSDGRAYTSILFDTDGSTDSDVLSVLEEDGGADGMCVIHTTYKSAAKVAEALKEKGEKLLVIYDEAHHYNHSQLGELTSLTKDILLVSGTWRGIPASIMSSDEGRQYIMTITEAIDTGIIVPQRYILPRNVDVDAAGIETQAEFIVTATMRLGYGPRRHLLYSPTIADATEIVRLLEAEFARQSMHMEARIITGTTPAAERDATIKWMSKGDRNHVRVISSVHVFDDGIDIPAVDCVFIQSVGEHNLYRQRAFRSVRLYAGKEIATVMVWSTPEAMVDLCQDHPGWEQTIHSMAPSLKNVDRAAEKEAVQKAISVIGRGIVGFSEWRWEKMFEIWKLARHQGEVKQRTRITVDGQQYAVGDWQNRQRMAIKKSTLSDERIAKLQEVGFIEGKRHPWEASFEAWRLACAEGPVGSRTTYTIGGEEFAVGEWCRTQRRAAAAGTLSAERSAMLESVHQISMPDGAWNANLKAWCIARDAGGMSNRTSVDMDGKPFHVGTWQTNQRRYRERLSGDQVDQLNEAGFRWEGKYGGHE
ncbi:P-loop containing nucleoside triphosphate hydrolase protein [Tribonema minus]|uniref:P-loop containing nucleoside triphosphate hydrolase protein n=1 Tax=Tribonema minus TaxID=303371 RepID=A0A836CIJ5_9STRA|nr:P-loop containing nucleoside triphosphate hydrolase protein [Tribonema minus]